MPTPKAPRHTAFLRQCCRCFYCGFPMWEHDPEPFMRHYGVSLAVALRLRCTAEHLKARQDGGSDAADNIAAACQFCNVTRHKMPQPLEPTEYRARVQQRVARGGWHHRHIHRLRDKAPIG